MAFIKASAANIAHATQHSDLSIVISSDNESKQIMGLSKVLSELQKTDPRVGRENTLVALDSAPGGRVLHVPAPDLSGDYIDVRLFFKLGKEIALLLHSLESRSPSIFFEDACVREDSGKIISGFENALALVYLGICQGLWQPLEAIEFLGDEKIEPLSSIYLIDADPETCELVSSIEAGKRVARDLCGTEPERMAPPRFADYCQQVFSNTTVACTVEDNIQTIAQDYPLLFAVARASIEVERHQPRVIRLEYKGEGEITHTLYFAGKGITYDTGGADLKVNGHMAGMSRDKGGAAAVAGLMFSIAKLQPKGIRVVALIGAVRNSIGAEAYVPDEIIMSHAGVRVRVGNTDAEGRMVLSDLLSHMRVEASNAPTGNDHLFSVATLTGHAAIAFGPYTALIENASAKQRNTADSIILAGEKWGDPCEQSLLRPEDFQFIKPRTKADDVLSSNNAPSVSTVRGHQFPAAFLIVSAGLDQHGTKSDLPLNFTHIDIAGSGVENLDWQHGKPTAAPVAALLNGLVLSEI